MQRALTLILPRCSHDHGQRTLLVRLLAPSPVVCKQQHLISYQAYADRMLMVVGGIFRGAWPMIFALICFVVAVIFSLARLPLYMSAAVVGGGVVRARYLAYLRGDAEDDRAA
jgi:hypothetical protein